MADLIPIPIVPAQTQTNTDFRSRPGEILPQPQDGRLATLSDLSQVVRNHNLSEDMGEQNLADTAVMIPRRNEFTPKDPVLAAKLLKALLSADMVMSLRAAGDGDLVNKLTEFADEVMQSPESLPVDLTRQQGKTTMFSGDIWNLLRGIFGNKIAPDAAGVDLAKLLGNQMPEARGQKTEGSGQHTDTGNHAALDNANPEQSGKTAALPVVPDKAEQAVLYNNKITARQADVTKPHVVTAEQMKQLVLNKAAVTAFPKNEIYKNAAFDFLKAAVTTGSKEDIINSIAANLKYLAGEAAPSMQVRGELNRTAENLNIQTFPELKGKILELLNTTSGSLLLNNNTKELIPLTVYNMSRLSYGTDDLMQSFSELVKLSDPQVAEKLRQSFVKYVENAELSSEDKVNLLEGSEINSAKHSMTLIAERLADSAAAGVSKIPAETLADTLDKLIDLYRRDTGVSGGKSGYGDPDGEIYTSEESAGNAKNLNNTQNTAGTLSQTAMNGKTTGTAAGAAITPAQETVLLQKTSETVKQVVAEFIPDNMKGALNTVMRDFDRTKNLNELAGRLSMIINKIPESDKKMLLADALNELLGTMSQNKSVNYTPPTATETLADFLAKNINDPALKTLSELNSGEMVRSLLAAPGSNTPLVHMMAPLELGGLRAFGELWADPNAEWIDPDGKNSKHSSGSDTDPVSHVFLAFDVENTGYFEMELYAKDKDLIIAIMCPKDMEAKFSKLTSIIPKLCQSQGYNTRDMKLSSIFKPRELTEVFPKLNRNVTGLNVRC